MYALTFNAKGLTDFSNVQINVASRVYNRQQARKAARWLSKSIGRTVTVKPAQYGPVREDGTY